MNNPSSSNLRSAFTLIELLVVVVIIAILASLVVLGYRSVTGQAGEVTLKSDLKSNSEAIELHKLWEKSYPGDDDLSSLNDGKGLVSSGDNQISYTKSGDDYCLDAANNETSYHMTSRSDVITEGDCSGVTFPVVMQTITSAANCPETRTMGVDARDNHTYWIQKLDDGKCWMLTNLAYAGGTSNGGTSAYEDVKTINKGTYTENSHYTDTVPYYFNHHDYDSTSKTSTAGLEAPSAVTTGGGTGADRQYGYHYNWCAAMGGQSTSACAYDDTPAPDPSQTICPSGWRLPTGGSGGEFTALTTAIGATDDSTGSAVLRSAWLAQYGGNWNIAMDDGSFGYQGVYGIYWSSSQVSAGNARILEFGASSVSPAVHYSKSLGTSVRCLVQ